MNYLLEELFQKRIDSWRYLINGSRHPNCVLKKSKRIKIE